MQEVSTVWKNTLGCVDVANRPYFVPESYVEIEYAATDPDAQENATIETNGSEAFSNLSEITNLSDKAFTLPALFEANSWELDGERKIVDGGTFSGNMGYYGNVLSNGDCAFATRPIIQLLFDKVYTTTIPGLQITWGKAQNEWAEEYIIRVYNNETVVQTFNVISGSVTSGVEQDITGYDKIEIEVVKWSLPYCRAKIEEIVLGARVKYTRDEILSFEHKRVVDLTSNSLPTNQIKFSLSNVDKKWNPHNPTGATKYLIAKQAITYRYGYKLNGEVEWITGGEAYLSEWITPTNGITSSFTAGDLMEYMTGAFDTNGISSTTLYDLVNAAFTQANIPAFANGSPRWFIDESLKDITITLPEGFKYTRAATVQLAANAAKCVMYQDRNGIFHVEPFNNGETTDYLIDEFVSYSNAEVN